MDWLILLLAFLFVTLQQSFEAIANKSYPLLNGMLRRFHVVIILFYFVLWGVIVYFFIPNYTPYIKLFLGYWFIAFAVCDLAWNITTIILGTKIPLLYYGTTKWWDRQMTKLADFGWFMKFVLGVVGFCFLMGWE